MHTKRLQKLCIAAMAVGLIGSLILATNSVMPKSAEAHALPATQAQAPLYIGTVNCGAYDVIIVPHDDASVSDAREAADRYSCSASLGTH